MPIRKRPSILQLTGAGGGTRERNIRARHANKQANTSIKASPPRRRTNGANWLAAITPALRLRK
jgi:hypothetical protein